MSDSTISSTNGVGASSYIRAGRAYGQALANKASAQPSQGIANGQTIPAKIANLNVLRQGGIIETVSKTSAIPNFAQFFEKLAKERIKKLNDGEKKSTEAILGTAEMVEVMAAVNESEIALQELVLVRDKIINAYKEIMSMPL